MAHICKGLYFQWFRGMRIDVFKNVMKRIVVISTLFLKALSFFGHSSCEHYQKRENMCLYLKRVKFMLFGKFVNDIFNQRFHALAAYLVFGRGIHTNLDMELKRINVTKVSLIENRFGIVTD